MRRENVLGPDGVVGAESVLTWRVHLLNEEPKRALLIAPAVVLGLLATYAFFHSVLSMALVLLLLLASLADYLFPVRYEITSEGASCRTLFSRTFIEWRRVKKYYVDAHGIKLSPLARQGRLEAYRGVYLRFGDRKDAVIEVVRRMRDVVSTGSGG